MNAHTLPARHGVLWLLGGFTLFRRNPPLLTALTFAYLLLVVIINILPLIGPFLLPMVLPALTAMLGNGCNALEQRRPLTIDELTRGLTEQRIGMIRLGGLHLLGSTLLVLVSLALGLELNIDPNMDEAKAAELMQKLAIVMGLASPLLMAFWFAPLLTLWNGVPAAKAVFFSFVASWRKWRAFLAYGLGVAVIGLLAPALILVISSAISGALVNVLALALRMVLIFILAPVLIASVYLSYRDVFNTRPREIDVSV
jgi:hypothetical protein